MLLAILLFILLALSCVTCQAVWLVLTEEEGQPAPCGPALAAGWFVTAVFGFIALLPAASSGPLTFKESALFAPILATLCGLALLFYLRRRAPSASDFE